MRIKYAFPLTIRPFGVVTDNEGCSTTEYGTPYTIIANIQDNKDAVIASQYGVRLTEAKIGYADLSTDININDGVCINVATTDEPDFSVASISNYRMHKSFMMIKNGVKHV